MSKSFEKIEQNQIIFYENKKKSKYEINQGFAIHGFFGEIFITTPNELLIKVKDCQIKLYKTRYNGPGILNAYFTYLINILIALNWNLKTYLQLKGMGFRSNIKTKRLILKIGYSHLISYILPINIQIKKIKKHTLKIHSANYQQLRFFCEYIRNFRFPDIYRSKGINYKGEKQKHKIGKKTEN